MAARGGPDNCVIPEVYCVFSELSRIRTPPHYES
jgi:hypothetical protein